jgi:hypothetical protein
MMSSQGIQGQIFFNKWFAFLSLIACILVIAEELAAPIFGQLLSPWIIFIFGSYLLVGISWFNSPSVRWDSVGINVRPFGILPPKHVTWNSLRGFRKRNSNSVVLIYSYKVPEEKVFTGMLNKSDASTLVELLLSRGLSDRSEEQ